MFTGLVAELGTVQNLARQGESYHLTVAAKKVMNNLKIGDSVAVNGACLTVVEMTEGSLKKSLLTNTIACGVSVAVALSITRVMTGLPITWILVVGYSIALFLMIFTPKIFTMVAFDSGGAVSGPMTTSFLLPFIIGISYACGANVLTDAFGLVAFVALSPLITIQILGIIYKFKLNKLNKIDTIDETIIDFTRGNNNE